MSERVNNMKINSIPKSYVGVLDVLGFKELVENNSHEELTKIYQMFSEHITQSVAHYQFNKITTEKGTEIKPNLNRATTNSILISDSIILYTNDTTIDSFFDFMLTTWHLMSFGFFLGIPLRGAASVGAISVMNGQVQSNASNSHAAFVGRSIVDAYKWEQKQNWAGFIYSSECISHYIEQLKNALLISSDPNRLNRAISLDSLINRGFLVKYNVPLKDGTFSENYVANWPRAFNPKLNESTIRKSFERNNKSVISEEVTIKINNTIDFWRLTPEGQRNEISLSN